MEIDASAVDAPLSNGNELLNVEARESVMDAAPSTSITAEEGAGKAIIDASPAEIQTEGQISSVPVTVIDPESVVTSAIDEATADEQVQGIVADEEVVPTSAPESEPEPAHIVEPALIEAHTVSEPASISTIVETTNVPLEEIHSTADDNQSTLSQIKTEQLADDGEVDMNEESDDFATPPVDHLESVTGTTAIKSESIIPAPAEAPAAPPIAPSSNATNDEAATTFLKQTFDSFSKSSGSAQSKANVYDPEEYRNSLKRRIETDRRDGEAWLALINDTSIRADLQEIRLVYEDFFKVFPNAARQWQDYAAIELANSEFQNVESIFTRCLRSTPSTELWRFYLSYTRRVNPLPPLSKGPVNGEDSEREKVRKLIEGAYDFALRFIGQSRDAGEVWKEYLALLKERETNNQWQAGQKMDDIRRAYQRAVTVPLANIEFIWREYDAYENGLNRVTAKKFLAERSPAYMTARTVFREMKTLTDGLYRPLVPKVPSWAAPPSLSPILSPLTIARDRSQVEAWKKYLLWEESDPLQLEDAQILQSRITMAYRKATMHLRFFPEIWYMAASYCKRSARLEEAAIWLKNGMDACTGSFLLHFAYIEQAEARSEVKDCAEVFNALVDWAYSQIDAMNVNLDEAIRVIDEEGEQIKAEASARRRDEGAADVVVGEEREELRKMEEEWESRRELEREKVRPKVEEMKEHASLVWIKYMHFTRRQEGQRPSRAIFARARKSKHCTWQIFEANALMEYHCSKEVAVATKVFELALKNYGDDEAFVVRYLEFLLSINDDNNARALFERTVNTFTPERARPIWDRWSEYEYSFGDGASIAKIDERLSQVYPTETPVKRLVDRNSYMDLDVVGPRDLGLRTVIGGASAAERAVAASREIAEEAAGSSMANVPTGPSGRSFPAFNQTNNQAGMGEEDQQPPIKRARFGGRDAASPIPSGPRTVPPPRGVKRSVSPPARFVPPPRGEPPPSAPPINQAPPPPAYIEIPDGVMYFLDCLPSTASFDGPRFPAEDIIESLLRSNLPLYDFSKAGPPNNTGSFGGGGQARGGRRRGE
ncbi:hypothetical protein CBS101457_003280 [Exobasidium rhododendri]|nr:hypothetical protein CBS101457_003280 [Exobasidium rhododendri]